VRAYKSTCKRYGTLNLFAALEVANGQVKTAITPFEAARGISSVHGPGRGANSRRPARNFPASEGEGANDEDVLLIEEINRAPTRHCRLPPLPSVINPVLQRPPSDNPPFDGFC